MPETRSHALKAATSCKHVSVPKAASRSEMMNIAASWRGASGSSFSTPEIPCLMRTFSARQLEGHSLCTRFYSWSLSRMRGKYRVYAPSGRFREHLRTVVSPKIDPLWTAKLPTLSATLINRRVLQNTASQSSSHLRRASTCSCAEKGREPAFGMLIRRLPGYAAITFDQRLRRTYENIARFSRERPQIRNC